MNFELQFMTAALLKKLTNRKKTKSKKNIKLRNIFDVCDESSGVNRLNNQSCTYFVYFGRTPLRQYVFADVIIFSFVLI